MTVTADRKLQKTTTALWAGSLPRSRNVSAGRKLRQVDRAPDAPRERRPLPRPDANDAKSVTAFPEEHDITRSSSSPRRKDGAPTDAHGTWRPCTAPLIEPAAEAMAPTLLAAATPSWATA